MIDRLISVTRASDWRETERILVDYWMQQCPLICAPTADPAFDFRIDDTNFNDKLLHPIVCAYCVDKNAGTDITSLNATYGSKADKRNAFCGRVFRSGEATYSCKECACDPTCVLCYQCFLNSSHRSHKYRMGASGGNGYCDCGDVEAWKEDPTCKLHEVRQDQDEEQAEAADVSPEQLKEVDTRIRSLTRIILRFSTEVICWPDEIGLPNFLKEKEADANLPPYQTILLNDETHTYESVIRALNLSIHCNELQAMQLATIIDREGRASVRNGNHDYCSKAKDEIRRRTQKDSNQRTEKSGPLDVRVIDSRLVSLQNFAIRIIGWLTNQIRRFPPLADIVGDILLTEKQEMNTEGVSVTLMAHIMKRDRALWKGARISLHLLIMATILMNNEQKQSFSRLYVRLYQKVFDDFTDDDHDHVVSIAALSVQIFTVPTIARMLIAEESVIQVIFDALIDQCRKYLKPPDKVRFDFSARTFPHALRRAMYMLYDQRYLLSVVPSENEWTPSLRENFLRGCYSLIRFLSFMQGMDEVRRLTAEHQVWEQEWETAFNIQVKLQHIITLIICWANTDEIVHSRLVSHLINELELIASRNPEFVKKVAVEVNGIKAMCIPYDMAQGTVSVHQPLWRLLAGLFTAPPSFLQKICIGSGKEAVPEGMLNLKGKRTLLLEMPLRVFVLCSQSHAQMWRRNGFSLVNQIHNYSAPVCRAEMYDRDILMLQVCAALIPPDIYIIRVLHRFGLHLWAETNFEEIRGAFGNVATEDLSRCIVIVAEEMLQLFIIVIGERYMPGVGKSTLEALLRREVLHVLATEPKPFSQIEHAVPDSQLFAKLSVEQAVKSVADFRNPTATAPGIFSLKNSVRSEYNAFFYHYSKTDVSNADQCRQKATTKSTKKEVIVAAPPMPPPFEPFFQPIVDLLRSKMMMQLIRIVLERTARRSRFSGEGLFHRVLFLVAMGLNEQIKNKDFDFIGCAEEANIFAMMKSLVGKPEAESHADFLDYVLELYEKTKSKNKEADILPERKVEASESEMKAKKAAFAAKKRKQAMEQMNRLQKQFITQNQELIGKEFREGGEEHHKQEDDEEPLGILPEGSGFPVCLGIERSIAKCDASRRITCILCQEDEHVTANGQAIVCVAFMQKSTLFARLKQDEEASDLSGVFVPASLRNGAGTSTCGHMMHHECYKKFSELMRDRERGRNRQPMAFNPRIVDVNSGEYLCPLCKRLSNAVLPVLPPPLQIFAEKNENQERHIEFEDWINSLIEMYDGSSSSKVKPLKSHGRKRSHSERSLMELVGREADTVAPALSTSVPSSSAMSHMLEMEPTIHPRAVEMMEADDNDEGREDTAVERAGADGRLFAIITSIPDVMHKIKEMLIQPEKQQMESTRTHFSASIWDMVKVFLAQVYVHFQNKADTCHFNRDIMDAVLTFQTAAFSLRSIAMVLKRGGKPLFGAWNARQRECIYALSRSCAAATMNCHSSFYYLRLLLLQLLSPLLPHETTADRVAALTVAMDPKHPSDRSSPKASESKRKPEFHLPEGLNLHSLSSVEFASVVKIVEEIKKPVNILAIDMLSLAVEIAMCEGWERTDKDGKVLDKDGPVTFPHGSQNEQHAIRLALVGHLYQVIKTFDAKPIVSRKPSSPFQLLDDKALDELLLRLYTIARPGQELSSMLALKETLHIAVLEFLRPLSLLYHALTLVPPPEALKDPSVHEFEPLCRYLGFTPSIAEFLGGPCVEKLFALWTSTQENIPVTNVVRQPVLENVLLQLPEDFSELINDAAQFRCPSIAIDDHSSSVPTLCLVCGSLLCSQSYCCQRTVNGKTLGSCSYHMRNCTGLSGGLFLRIRDSQIVLLTTRERGCLHPAPYVDEYGETDPGFRRGNPLHLNHELYAKLENLWLNQGVAEEVVNQYEIDHRNMGFEWQHF